MGELQSKSKLVHESIPINELWVWLAGPALKKKSERAKVKEAHQPWASTHRCICAHVCMRTQHTQTEEGEERGRGWGHGGVWFLWEEQQFPWEIQPTANSYLATQWLSIPGEKQCSVHGSSQMKLVVSLKAFWVCAPWSFFRHMPFTVLSPNRSLLIWVSQHTGWHGDLLYFWQTKQNKTNHNF